MNQKLYLDIKRNLLHTETCQFGVKRLIDLGVELLPESPILCVESTMNGIDVHSKANLKFSN